MSTVSLEIFVGFCSHIFYFLIISQFFNVRARNCAVYKTGSKFLSAKTLNMLNNKIASVSKKFKFMQRFPN